MSLTSKLITDSFRKYPDGTYHGRVVTTDSKGNDVVYACRVLSNKTFDSENVYMLLSSKWQLIELTDHLLNVVKAPVMIMIENVGQSFTKNVTDKKGRKCSALWEDVVIRAAHSSYDDHTLKIGDKLFITCDCMRMFDPTIKTMKWRYVWEQSFQSKLFNVNSDKDVTGKLKELFESAYTMYSRRRNNNGPIGFNSYQELQDSRKEFGQSNRNAKELERSKR